LALLLFWGLTHWMNTNCVNSNMSKKLTYYNRLYDETITQPSRKGFLRMDKTLWTDWMHVPRLDKEPAAPIRASTAYKWWHLGRYPHLFRKVGGKLFIRTAGLFELDQKPRQRRTTNKRKQEGAGDWQGKR
jgi:hypothetical protein